MSTSESLVALVKELTDSNVHQTICRIYDLKAQLSRDVLSEFASQLALSCPPGEKPADMDIGQYVAACFLFTVFLHAEGATEELLPLLTTALAQLNSGLPSPAFDQLYAKIYFFYGITAEDPLPLLMASYRKCCDRHFHQSQATVVNSILRILVQSGGYKQALSFLEHSQFPQSASPSELGRYHFWVGHLRAITLDYSEAKRHLSLALRRSPQNQYSERFRALVTKHLVVVTMLQGQIPARSSLLDMPLYLELARVIRSGDLRVFETLSKHSQFEADGLEILVGRLRSSVILTGLNGISKVYSKILFTDIAELLHFNSAEDAEGFCAKMTADGLINAIIDHENGCLISKGVDPSKVINRTERIHKDIQDCFAIREDAQLTLPFANE